MAGREQKGPHNRLAYQKWTRPFPVRTGFLRWEDFSPIGRGGDSSDLARSDELQLA